MFVGRRFPGDALPRRRSLSGSTDAGWLPRRVSSVSSVSGGSITAGVLGARWSSLDFDTAEVASNFDEHITHPLRDFAHKKVDVSAVALGALLSGIYRALPDSPDFFINATNLESGVSMRFTKKYLADGRLE